MKMQNLKYFLTLKKKNPKIQGDYEKSKPKNRRNR